MTAALPLHICFLCFSTQQPYHLFFLSLFPFFHSSKTDLIFRCQWSGMASFVKIQSTYVCFIFFLLSPACKARQYWAENVLTQGEGKCQINNEDRPREAAEEAIEIRLECPHSSADGGMYHVFAMLQVKIGLTELFPILYLYLLFSTAGCLMRAQRQTTFSFLITKMGHDRQWNK